MPAARAAAIGPASGPGAAATAGPELIACPTCDALHHVAPVPIGSRGRCSRCGTLLAAPRERAMTNIVMLAATSLVLMVAAVFSPFIELSVAGMVRRSSVLDTALAFSQGPLLPLTLVTAAFIVILPATRLALIVYALAPMALGWHPARRAMAAFRLAEQMRPWAMAEIFIIGVSVAMVKMSSMASLHLGVAFWAMVGLVLINVLNDTYMDRLTIFRTLEQRSRRA